eukprot:3287342-Rhodomonas_salina.1
MEEVKRSIVGKVSLLPCPPPLPSSRLPPPASVMLLASPRQCESRVEARRARGERGREEDVGKRQTETRSHVELTGARWGGAGSRAAKSTCASNAP